MIGHVGRFGSVGTVQQGRAIAMKAAQVTSSVSIDDLWQAAICRLFWLRTKTMIGIDISRPLQDFLEILESLPLTTGEFGLARNRLNNAISYLACAQPGAARYELRLLEGSLRYWGEESDNQPSTNSYSGTTSRLRPMISSP
jgi:hypothetical protein